MKTVDPKGIPTAELQGYLQSSIGPRPIALASTVDEDGNPNLSPFSFFNIFSANPPIVIFSPSRRVRDNTVKHTLENVKSTKEVVINIVNYDMVQQTSLSSTEYEKQTNEFTKAGFTMIASDSVRPFRVEQSPVQLECIVKDIIALGEQGGAGNLVICEIVKIHISEEVLDENRQIDHRKIDLVARMGGNWYTRSAMGMFEVEKPLTTLGVGVDALPEEVIVSEVFSGNELGVLGNVEELPSADEISAFIASNITLQEVLAKDDIIDKFRLAKKYLQENNVPLAWKTILAK